MANPQGVPESLGHGIALILRELADLKAEFAQDRKQAARDRKEASQDRKVILRFMEGAEADRAEASKERKELTRALQIIGSEGKKFRVRQDELVKLVRDQRSILIDIRNSLKGGRNGRSRGNGHPAR